jgi:hypothetical protein
MRRAAWAMAVMTCCAGCTPPRDPVEPLSRQLAKMEAFCRGKSWDVYLECPIAINSLRVRIRTALAVRAGIPRPEARDEHQMAEAVARSRQRDAVWAANAAAGRLPGNYDHEIALVLKSAGLARAPTLPADSTDVVFGPQPYPGILCGATHRANLLAGDTTEPFAAYFDSAGRLVMIAQPPPLDPRSWPAIYADRANGPFADSDEASLFRICGIVPTT